MYEAQQVIAIAATFTAEPLKETISFWLQELAFPLRIELSQYNQVFQQLLDTESLFRRNQQGVNVILVRLEDWLGIEDNSYDEGGTACLEQGTHETIERCRDDFVRILHTVTKLSSAPYLVCLCPFSPKVKEKALLATYLTQVESDIVRALEDIDGIYCIDSTSLTNIYPVSEYYDDRLDKLAHIPFTSLFFTALGTWIMRTIYALRNNPFKVVVLDCDGTLWNGACGEDGPYGINIDAAKHAFQEFLVKQYNMGMLLCLCSKNIEQDVLEVFEKHPEMPLKLEHIVARRINWEPKSHNLHMLAQELHIALDSFIFIDDNPLERAEVEMKYPEILTIELPSSLEKLSSFLHHLWAFDHLHATPEDRKRTVFYQQDQQRQGLLKEAPTLEEYLAGLNLRVQITPIDAAQVSRAAQLTRRTNQFTMTTIRRSASEIIAFCAQETHECLVVEASDRFGEYGLVGVILFSLQAQTLNVDTFLLSCRALGRGIEHQMLKKLGEIALLHGLKFVTVIFRPTAKNKPALDFLESFGKSFEEILHSSEYRFNLPAELLLDLSYPLAPSGEAADLQCGTSLSPDTPLDRSGRTRQSLVLLNRIARDLHDPEQILQHIRILQYPRNGR